MSQPALKFERRRVSSVQLAWLIFLLALLVRLVLMVIMHAYDHPLRVEIHHLALSIASGQGFSNPYPTPTGPTAIYSPGGPLILAGIYFLFGSGTQAEIATYLLNIVAACAVFALLPSLSFWLGWSRRVGLSAGVAGALVPVYLLNEFRSTTAALGALCLVLLTLLSAKTWSLRPAPTATLGALFGLAWAVALLISPNLLLIGFLWLVLAALHYRAKLLRFTLAFLVVAAVIMSPWVVRNALVLHSPILFRSNLGLELHIANNDTSQPTYAANGESHLLYQPFTNPSEAKRFARLGEVAYMQQQKSEALRWIGNNPRRFTKLTLQRVFRFWFPVTYRNSQTAVVWVVTALAIVGMCFAWARQRTSFWLLGSIWIAYPFVYYFVQLDNPYRYPIYFSVLLLAAYGVDSLARWIHGYSPASLQNRLLSTSTRQTEGELVTQRQDLSSPLPHHGIPKGQLIHMLGSRVHLISVSQTVDEVERWIEKRDGACRRVVVTGFHGLWAAYKNPRLQSILNSAELWVPDGIAPVWVARLRGHREIERTPGAEIMRECFSRAGANKYRSYFYGETEATLLALQARMAADYPEHEIAGAFSPPFRELTPAEDDEIIDRINAAQPDILWVGLGMPKQDLWIYERLDRLKVPVAIGVGAAFTFVAGTVSRCPEWVGRSGFEWIYRFIKEPGKLWRRDLLDGPKFLFHALLELRRQESSIAN